MPDLTKEDIIHLLGLTPHPAEGGYFRRTYESNLRFDCGYGSRLLMTSIYYMLTKESPIAFLHRNKSDIIHYHHLGASVKYIIISPDGILSQKTLGSDIKNGETLQLLVPSGWWKASHIYSSEYALISEAVAPGFEYMDNEIATTDFVKQNFPDLQELLKKYIKNTGF